MSLRSEVTGNIITYEIHHFVNGRWSRMEPPPDVVGKELADSWSASGRCWQECGIHGTFQEEVGIKTFFSLKRSNYNHPIKLVRREYVVKEELIYDN